MREGIRTALLIGGILSWATGTAYAADPFTIVALPDTQNYVNNPANAGLFTQQTQWIADEVNGVNARNIQFVSHLGDVVSNGNDLTQWSRADTSMSVLDGVIEYGVLPGNHDYNSTGNKSTGTVNYVNNFGPSRFAGQGWYGGADPSGNNSYQTFSAGGYDFIHLALEWRPAENVPVRSPSPIEWAQSILDANPNTPFILSTHENLDDSPPGRAGAGQALWDQLVRSNDQVFMVLNGHNHGSGGTNDGEYHQVSLNDAGREVYEVLQDYQDYPNGGDGWLRLIEFDVNNDKIKFETYSPVLDQFQTETIAQVGQFASQFEFDVDFADRLDPVFIAPPPLPYTEVTFRQGQDGYTGTHDKEVRADGADTSNGQDTSINVDGDAGRAAGNQPTHGLIRFDSLASGASPILPGTQIDSARLNLSVFDEGSGFSVYQMTAGWTESTTWADLGGDGVTPGVDSQASPLTAIGADNGNPNVRALPRSLNITDAAQQWIDGVDNFGVGLIPFANGTNGVVFDTSESAAPPQLAIRILDPGVHSAHFAQGEDGYTGVEDTSLLASSPDTNVGSRAYAEVDTSSAKHSLLRFNDLFGVTGGRIPVGAGMTILRAELELTVFDAGDPVNLHEMLIDWDENIETWNTLTSGIQADDVEASSTIVATLPGLTGLTVIDVTDSIQNWLDNPSSNFGWALLPTGSNGVDFETAEGFAAPALHIYYALAGDLNGDGFVGLADLDIILNAWNQEVDTGEWSQGDPSGDGFVGLDDLDAVLNHWNNGTPPGVPNANIPEPASLLIVVMAGAGLSVRRCW